MAHVHSVYDSDTHFTIDPVTRAIKNVSSSKTTLIQYDHNSERFTFEIPRYIEGHDMSTSSKIEVHFRNIDAATKEASNGLYIVDDMQLSPADDEIVICSWLISRTATKYVGALDFLLRFTCITGDTVDYAWNTAIFSGISISSGIDNSDASAAEYSDLLAWLESRLGGLSFRKVSAAEFAAMPEHDENTVYFVQDGEEVKQYIGTAELSGGSMAVNAGAAAIASADDTSPDAYQGTATKEEI